MAVFRREETTFEMRLLCNFDKCPERRPMRALTAIEHMAQHFYELTRRREHFNMKCDECGAEHIYKSHHRLCRDYTGRPHPKSFRTIYTVPMTDEEYNIAVDFDHFVGQHLIAVTETGERLSPGYHVPAGDNFAGRWQTTESHPGKERDVLVGDGGGGGDGIAGGVYVGIARDYDESRGRSQTTESHPGKEHDALVGDGGGGGGGIAGGLYAGIVRDYDDNRGTYCKKEKKPKKVYSYSKSTSEASETEDVNTGSAREQVKDATPGAPATLLTVPKRRRPKKKRSKEEKKKEKGYCVPKEILFDKEDYLTNGYGSSRQFEREWARKKPNTNRKPL